uniref:Uncharacterized protein n=1 Tax=Anguilla anguilla TaxID=7936 RepID=A0A0E9Q431_ANGAN
MVPKLTKDLMEVNLL